MSAALSALLTRSRWGVGAAEYDTSRLCVARACVRWTLGRCAGRGGGGASDVCLVLVAAEDAALSLPLSLLGLFSDGFGFSSPLSQDKSSGRSVGSYGLSADNTHSRVPDKHETSAAPPYLKKSVCARRAVGPTGRVASQSETLEKGSASRYRVQRNRERSMDRVSERLVVWHKPNTIRWIASVARGAHGSGELTFTIKVAMARGLFCSADNDAMGVAMRGCVYESNNSSMHSSSASQAQPPSPNLPWPPALPRSRCSTVLLKSRPLRYLRWRRCSARVATGPESLAPYRSNARLNR